MIKIKPKMCFDCGKETDRPLTLIRNDYWVCAKCVKNYEAW